MLKKERERQRERERERERERLKESVKQIHLYVIYGVNRHYIYGDTTINK